MNYLLDTNACVAILEEYAQFRRRYEMALIEGHSIYLSSIVYFELFYGALRSSRPDANRLRLFNLRSGVWKVLPFDETDAESAAGVRAYLESVRSPIGHYDTLIAGQAVARGITLVTANVREFERVPGLAWQDWERS